MGVSKMPIDPLLAQSSRAGDDAEEVRSSPAMNADAELSDADVVQDGVIDDIELDTVEHGPWTYQLDVIDAFGGPLPTGDELIALLHTTFGGSLG